MTAYAEEGLRRVSVGRLRAELAEFRAAARVLNEQSGNMPTEEIMWCFDGLRPDVSDAIRRLSRLAGA